MLAIKDNVEYFQQGYTLDDIKKHCEKCGRICYKSEGAIKEGSAEKFIGNLIKSQHYSVLEHGTVYLTLDGNMSGIEVLIDKYQHNKYSKVNYSAPWKQVYITTNYRVIVENEWEEDLAFLSEPTQFHEKRYTLFLTVDRGVGEEFLRHRPFSYSKESTRYCRYSAGKFGSQVTTIIPEADFPLLEVGKYDYVISKVGNNEEQMIGYWKPYADGSFEDIPNYTYQAGSLEYTYLKGQIEQERTYMELINYGWTAQQARRALSLAIKGEFVMSGFESDWQHVIDWRYHEVTGKVHPDMMHISEKMYNLFKDNNINIK